MCSKSCCCFFSSVLFLLFASSLVAAVIFGIPFVEDFVANQVDSTRILLNESNPLFPSWVSNANDPNAPPEFLTFYLWNVTNAKEVSLGENPKLQQLGPFVYRDYFERFGVEWDEKGETVSSFYWEYYVFDDKGVYCGLEDSHCVEMTEGVTPDDYITTLNIPYAAVMSQLAPNDEWWGKLVVDMLMSASQSELFVTVKIEELLWGGRDYKILELLNSTLKPGTPTQFSLQQNQTSREMAVELNNFKKDSWNTGKLNITQVGQFTKWKGQSEQDIWGSELANKVRGTDGTGFHPRLSSDEKLLAFVTSAFRTTSLVYDDDVEVKGIKLFRYLLAKENLVNASVDPAYFLYAPPGLVNLSAPLNGTPIFLSKPLFLDADESYQKAIDFNIERNVTIHDTFIDVEPTTGIVMNARKRLQANILVKGSVVLFPHLKDIFFPIAWFEQGGTIGETEAAAFKDKIYLIQNIIKYGRYILYTTGALLLILAAMFLIIGIKSRPRHRSYDLLPGVEINT